jgi:hypothetical protein
MRSAWQRLQTAVGAESHHLTVLRLSLVLLLLHGAASAWTAIPIRALCSVLLVLSTLTQSSSMWLLLTGSVAFGFLAEWYNIDNHKYLILYWSIACVISTRTGAPSDTLGKSAKWLIGLAFLSAVVAKLLSSDYVDGSFFYWTFFTDGRLQPVTAELSGVSFQDLRTTGEAIRLLGLYGGLGEELTLPDAPRVHALALALSWIGLVIEALIALLHLLPGRSSPRCRHTVLMVFIAFTYILLPVTGFAFVLSVMGFAQCDAGDVKLKSAYICLTALGQLVLVPWQGYMAF